jgi:hypothetical protein
LTFAAAATLGVASAATIAVIATMFGLVTMVMSLPVPSFLRRSFGSISVHVPRRFGRTEPFSQGRKRRRGFKVTEPFGHNQLIAMRYLTTVQRRELGDSWSALIRVN